MYVVEGLHQYDEAIIQTFFEHLMDSIRAQTQNQSEGHYALKLTALISTDIMTRMSNA